MIPEGSTHQNPAQTVEAGKAKRLLLRVVFLFLLINGVILYKVLQESEPTYQGKTLSAWLAIGGPQLRPEVVNAFGPDAAPYLAKHVAERSTWLRRTYNSLWHRLPQTVQRKFDSYRPIDPSVLSHNAREWLRELGQDAKAIIPDLIRLVQHEKKLGNRLAAIQTLSFVGVESDEALQVLVGVLKEPEIVWNPVFDLGRRLPSAPQPNSLPKTMSYFTFGDWVAPAVARFGARGKAAVPFLAESIRRRGGGNLHNQINALGEIGPEAKAAVPVLQAILNNPALRDNVLSALAGIGEGARETVPVIVPLLEAADLRVRARSLEILFNIGPSAQAAIGSLKKIESDPQDKLRIPAAVVVAKIEQDPAHSLAILTSALSEEGTFEVGIWSSRSFAVGVGGQYRVGTGIAETAAWILGELGKEAEPALPALERATASDNRWVRILAARATWKITQRDDKVEPILDQCKAAKASRPVLTFLPIYEELGPRARVVTPELIAFIHDRRNRWSERREALKVLQKVDPDAAAQVSLR